MWDLDDLLLVSAAADHYRVRRVNILGQLSLIVLISIHHEVSLILDTRMYTRTYGSGVATNLTSDLPKAVSGT